MLATWAVGAFHIWQQSWYGGAAPAHWLRAGSVGVDLLVMLSAFCLFLPWANAAVRDQPLPRIRPAEFYRRPRPAAAARLLRQPAVRSGAGRGAAWVEQGAGAGSGRPPGADPAALPPGLPGLPAQRRDLDADGVCTVLSRVPLLAPLAAKWPLPTLAALGLVQLGYTCWLLPQYGSGDYSARFNQLPAFSGVLAVGLAAAWVFAKFAHGGWAQHVLPPQRACTALGLAALIWLDAEMRAQAAAAEYQQFQLINRMPLVLAAAAVLVCFGPGPDAARGLRRALRWLAALTYSFYLWHQMLTVFLKYDLHLPAWAGDTPPNRLVTPLDAPGRPALLGGRASGKRCGVLSDRKARRKFYCHP